MRGILAFVSMLALVAVSCGGGGESESEEFQFQKVASSDETYELEDFQAIGFKKSKQYDVTGLPGGVDAYMGFFGPDPSNRKQYELRFYASHEDAVQQGAQLAEEVTGADAVLITSEMTWKEGAKDRRVQSGRIGQLVPVYGDYAIYGNVLMLCEGAAIAESRELCGSLVRPLVGAGSE